MAALRTFSLALLLGALSAFGFAPYGLWPLTIACLMALVAMLRGARGIRRAGAIGWWFGFGQFCVGLNWIATAFTYQAAMPAWLGWVAVVLLSLYLAVYPALAAGAARLLGRDRPGLFLAATWIVGEYLRATLFTGFPWNPLGVIWVPLLPVAGLARLIGTYGLSGLTILFAAGLLAALRALIARLRQRPAIVDRATVVLAAFFVPMVLGVAIAPGMLAGGAPARGGVHLHIVQPDINQAEKWQADFQARNFARLAALTGRPTREPRLILWPEVAVPDYLEEDAAARARLAALLGPRDLLLTGGIALRYDRAGNVVAATNSLFALDAAGRLLGRYDKAHLVPYGEYLPMRPLLSRLGLSRLAPGDIDFLPGPGPRDVIVPGLGPVGVQICYEMIFSGHVVDRAHRPRFLFNPSNDAWFGRWGPPQHLAQARLRAIEEGLPVVRATPTGISAVIDADGHLIASLPWRAAGAIDAWLPPARRPTPFARLGNLLPLAFALLIAIAGFASRRRAR